MQTIQVHFHKHTDIDGVCDNFSVSCETIYNLKESIANFTKLKIDGFRIVWHGRQWGDHQPISAMNLQENDIISVVYWNDKGFI